MVTKRGQRSSIEKLDKQIVEAVNSLIKDGHTISEIVDKLTSMGADVSRSAVGRYSKSFKETIQKYKEAQEVAKVWIDRIGKEPDGDVARLLPELLRVIAFSSMSALGEGNKPVKAGEIMALSIAIRNLSATNKTDMDVAMLRRRIREQAQEAATKVAAVAKKAGVSAESINQIKSDILGIGKESRSA